MHSNHPPRGDRDDRDDHADHGDLVAGANAQVETTGSRTGQMVTTHMGDGDSDSDGEHDDEGASSRYHREQGDPVRLRVASNGTSWIFNMGAELRAAGIEGGDTVTVDFIWDDGDEDPMLIFGKLPDRAGDGEFEDAARTRTVSDHQSTLSVKPPKEFLESDPDLGLGLDIDAYDNSNPLLFEPLVMEDAVGLVPIDHYEAVTAAQREAEGDEAEEGDDAEADAPRQTDPEHPVSESAVATAAQVTGVTAAALQSALAMVAEAVGPDDVEPVEEFAPLEADGHTVLVVDDEQWRRIAEQAGLDDTVGEAARLAHTQYAEDLAVAHGGSEFRRFSRRYDAVVF